MKAEVGISKSIFPSDNKYYLVINKEYYIKITKNRYYDFKKYMKEKNNG